MFQLIFTLSHFWLHKKKTYKTENENFFWLKSFQFTSMISIYTYFRLILKELKDNEHRMREKVEFDYGNVDSFFIRWVWMEKRRRTNL